MSSNPDSPDDGAEESARADVYGVLSALFYAPPEPALLASLRAAPAGAEAVGGELEAAWQALVHEARSMELPDIAAEYDSLFGGFGKPEVYLFGSHYLSGFLNEKPLAYLREDLKRLGLARSESVSETEDHYSCLCDIMRHLIASDAEGAAATLEQQRMLFEQHIGGWVEAMCDAVQQHPAARFYAAAAQFARAFTSVERQAFEMLESQHEGRLVGHPAPPL